MSQAISLIVVDDDDIYRRSMCELLEQEPGVLVATSLNSGASAVEAVRAVPHDAILLDVSMPGMDGITTLKKILEHNSAEVVLMLTAFERAASLQESLAAGAKGFLTKETPAPDIVAGIRRALAGKQVLGAKPLQVVTDFFVSAAPSTGDKVFKARVEALPDYLRNIVDFIALAYTNREIARASKLAESTVTTYVKEALSVLGNRRGEVVMKMARLGMTPELSELQNKQPVTKPRS